MAIIRRENSPSRYVSNPLSYARDLFGWDPFGDVRPGTEAFSPSFEVKETNDQFVVRADVPGVEDKDIDVSLHNGILAVTGTRAGEQRQEGEAYYLYERQFGSFTRSFSLPDSADGDKVAAKLENGVLTITIGKRAEAKPRKIALSKS
jgi:HSP20 family protein